MMAALPMPRAQEANIAFIELEAGEVDRAVEWSRLCLRFTPCVEQVSASSALLDLGASPLAAARQQMEQLIALLGRQGVAARVGIGPTSILAQLALLMAPPDTRLAAVTAPQAPGLLRGVPVQMLARGHPYQALLGPDVIARLEGYGLRTLGHLARIAARALRQQFGDQVGRALVALGQGADLQPLRPTPPAHWHRARLRWTPALDPLAAERALLALPGLVGRAVALLDRHAAGALRLSIDWCSGQRQIQQVDLRVRSADPRRLQPEAERLLRAALAAECASAATDGMTHGIEAMGLWLGACATQQPAQTTFWRTAPQRQETVNVLADALARRHGRSLLLRPCLVAPTAIFAEDGYALRPTGTTGAAGPGAGRAHAHDERHSGRPGVANAWDEVPHRLHWW